MSSSERRSKQWRKPRRKHSRSRSSNNRRRRGGRSREKRRTRRRSYSRAPRARSRERSYSRSSLRTSRRRKRSRYSARRHPSTRRSRRTGIPERKREGNGVNSKTSRNRGGAAENIEASLKRMEERMESRMKLMASNLRANTGPSEATLQRQDFIAAALRLPEGDPWREKALRDYTLDSKAGGNDVQRRWVQKSNAENFRQWLAGPEGAAPFDLNKIFKALGYSIDLTQRNLPPAVPCMLMSLIFMEGQHVDQVRQAARWFFEVGKTGFRFQETPKFLEYMRRAIELRRSPSSS